MPKLTVAEVRKLIKQPVQGTRAVRHADGGSLYLVVTRSGGAAWSYRFKAAGKVTDMGLGTVADVPLAEARAKAAEARKKVRAGINPIEERRDAKAALIAKAAGTRTFAEAAEAFLTSAEGGWKNEKHRLQWRSTLTAYVFPSLGKTPVADIQHHDITPILEALSDRRETASRVRGRIERVLSFAFEKGWRPADNPAVKRNFATILGRKKGDARHHPALAWMQMPGFMSALRGQAGVSALALEFLILTAARTNEVLGARWSEIDLAAAVWTVPADRMKAGREHRVPLSEAAQAVLRAAFQRRERPDGYVFPGARQGSALSGMALLMLLRRMGRGDLTAHGFRSTFRDWAAEAHAAPRELAEAALAHRLRDKVEAAYQRGDLLERRRVLMTDWAAFCSAPAASAAA